MTYINKAPVIKYVEGGGATQNGRGDKSSITPTKKAERGGGVLAMLKEGGGGGQMV